jgi:hypothetical protein
MTRMWMVTASAGVLASALSGCGSSNAGAGGASSTSSTSTGTSSGGNAQTPPMGGTAVEAWLAEGDYKQWACEAAVHAARSPSVHGFNRICSNSAISTNATGTGSWPSGAAAVKELYASLTDTTPDGYAVYLKTAAASDNGASWYYYERVPLDSTAPHDANGVVADGLGASGPPLTTCVACHSAAGSDAAHTPSPGSRDFVYTPVQ